MSSYHVVHATAVGTNLPLVNITGGTTVRLNLTEVLLGCGATAPAEQSAVYRVFRTTSAGTGGTALLEEPDDPLSAAAIGAALGGTFTGAPAVGSILLRIGLHQKLPWRWNAYPGRQLVSAAVAANGIEVESLSGTSGFTEEVTMGWFE